MAKQRDLSALMGKQKPQQVKKAGGKKTKTTIVFDVDDEAEIYRIQDVLRARGLRVNEATKIVRIALRVAFGGKTDEDIQEICNEMAERWKRGG